MTAKELKESIIMVTGGARGIGQALASGFAKDGAKVVAVGREFVSLESGRVAAGCPAERWQSEVADLADREALERLFARVISRHGRIDVLINNAAVYPKKKFLEIPIEEWIRSIEINVGGLAHCCHLALPLMLEHRYGRILNVGSFAWKGPNVGSTDYCASKAAVAAFSKALALEVDRICYPNILINEFIPGIVKTGMSDHGDDPVSVYQHAKFVVSQPSGSPSGATYLRSALVKENQPSFLGRVRRKFRSVLGGIPD